jgi:anaerobic ribonucleoside-triphosphate reductase activating protein
VVIDEADVLRVAQVIPDTEAEGPGRRFAVWVQGCPLRCPGCCNPEMLPVTGGAPRDVDDLAREASGSPGIEGITLLGGEPFAQAAACARLARRARASGLSVMVFSGFTLAELEGKSAEPGVTALLGATDLLVDGRYLAGEPESSRRWIGSQNQVMHFLTDRYAPQDPRFRAKNTVEIRLRARELTVNGWPALARTLGDPRSGGA